MADASDVIMVSPYFKAVYEITVRAMQQGWDRRRTKRELRRIGCLSNRRAYNKQVSHG